MSEERNAHTPEPWSIGRINSYRVEARIDELNGFPLDEDDAPYCIANCWSGASAPRMHIASLNAARIVACVNACAGIEDPAAFVARAQSLEARVKELERENAELKTWQGFNDDTMMTVARVKDALAVLGIDATPQQVSDAYAAMSEEEYCASWLVWSFWDSAHDAAKKTMRYLHRTALSQSKDGTVERQP